MFFGMRRPPSDAERTAQIQKAREDLAVDPELMHFEREPYEPEMTRPMAAAPFGPDSELDAAKAAEEAKKAKEATRIEPGSIIIKGHVKAEDVTVEAIKIDVTRLDGGPIESLSEAMMNRLSPQLWNLGSEPPEDAKVYIVMGRYPDAKRGSPRFALYVEGTWIELSRNKPEPLVVWAWISRDILGAWPEEPV